MPTLPQRTRVYRCHHLDSTRWDDIVPRPDDIVITTSLKAGTTWTQRIVSLLVFDGLPYRESTKYIYVGRDTRDVFMSTWNHIRAYTPFARELLNSGENP